ncbi:hypothetical protein O181_062039 [Austropuccinia psidii MF-1]|uniref:Uncharacterized protein n=1 Tax=Austropuccinia psidii MF-1 TaxID=1389203 RepID=A0A9Q3I165_9BASI|nr:hypothetical protein [Austropuccinia psidii MF-1]
MKTIHKEGKIQTNADDPSRCTLDNVKRNPAYDQEVAAKIPISFMEVDRGRKFGFLEWEPEGETPNYDKGIQVKKETPILRRSSSELHTEFFIQCTNNMLKRNNVEY